MISDLIYQIKGIQKVYNLISEFIRSKQIQEIYRFRSIKGNTDKEDTYRCCQRKHGWMEHLQNLKSHPKSKLSWNFFTNNSVFLIKLQATKIKNQSLTKS